MKKPKKVPNSIDLNELRLKQRRTWEINPKTRVKDDSAYNRAKEKLKFKKEIDND